MKCPIFEVFLILFPEIIINVEPKKLHWMEQIHDPSRFAALPPNVVNGTDMPKPVQTPDYRIEEPPFLARHPKKKYTFNEEQRPFRISPHHKQTKLWSKGNTWFGKDRDNPQTLGCYCTTVYKRLTLLAGCAVLTNRHVLTTATSTELILRKFNSRKPGTSLLNILGVWYDNNRNYFNSSMYAHVARIAYHPKYMYPHEVNISHPIPCVFDLAVWSTTIRMAEALTCSRGGPHWIKPVASVPHYGEMMLVVGFQFIKAHKKVPMPWFKYVVRTRQSLRCPKSDGWGWFACIEGQSWSKFGLDSGAALHRTNSDTSWSYEGLIGLNAFSARLRSDKILHYFTVINTHPVLDFLYDAYMGRMRHEYLDPRFNNYKRGAPIAKVWIAEKEEFGKEEYKSYDMPFY